MTVIAKLPNRIVGALRRAFTQFLALPLGVVVGFILLALLFYQADTAWSDARVPIGFSWLGELLGDSTSLATLLSTIASSIITVTSITFSLLLIALQQGSSALTTQVTDQFLMRRVNQFYFGYFVGLSIFVLISLVTASAIHRPVFGTTLALLLTAVALCMIVVMIYNTIDQMRPRKIVRTIHAYVLRARDSQLPLLRRSRRAPRPGWVTVATLKSQESGHVVGVDADKLKAALGTIPDVEVRLLVPLGRYLAFNDPIAEIRGASPGSLPPALLADTSAAVLAALSFDDTRNLMMDASYGVSQLSDIAWTSISTAKSNPDPGSAVIESLRDILARWAAEGEVPDDPTSLLVLPDAAPYEAIDAMETIIVVTSESIQAQSLVAALRTVATLLADVPQPWADRLADVAMRALASLGEHVLTRELEDTLHTMVGALRARGFTTEAEAVDVATSRFATTSGVLNSRSTRVPAGG